MPTHFHQVTIPHVSGLARDASVNTFCFDGAGANLAAEAALLIDFYSTSPDPQTLNPLAQFLSLDVSRAALAASVRSYVVNPLLDVIGEADLITPWTVPADVQPSTNFVRLPEEVAVCFSFGKDLSKRSQRGRIFFGPLGSRAMEAPGGGVYESRPAQIVLDSAAAACKRLMNQSNAMGSSWSVWSRKDNVAHGIVRGFIDREFDTMRSRGQKAPSRTSWVG